MGKGRDMYCLRRQKRACAGCWMEFNCSLHLLRCVSEGRLWDGVLDIHPTFWCWQRMGVTHTGSEPERPVWVQITAYLTLDSVWLLVDCPWASAHWLWHWHADSVGLMGNPSTKTHQAPTDLCLATQGSLDNHCLFHTHSNLAVGTMRVWMQKSLLREMKWCPQGHTAGKGQVEEAVFRLRSLAPVLGTCYQLDVAQ